MIRVLFQWYPERGGEPTHWTQMQAVPRVGDAVTLSTGESGPPIMDVRRVLWVYNEDMTWHAEITLSSTT